MPLLMQVCVVIVTTALVIVAIMAIRAMDRFGRAADQVTDTVDAFKESLADAKRTSTEVRELVVSLEEFTTGVKGVAARLEQVGNRAADVSTAVLDEIEAPIRKVAGVVLGLRAGTSMLLDKLTSRRVTAAHNGGHHE